MDEFKEENRLKLLEDYIKTKGLLNHQLDSFNKFINHDIKNIIDDEASIIFKIKDMETERKVILRFENVTVSKPTLIDGDRIIRPLYPIETKQMLMTYDSIVYVDINEYSLDESMVEKLVRRYNRIQIARIPIMVGSSACNTYNLTAREKFEHGETPNDHGGYFIINGNERIIVAQLRNAYNRTICYTNKLQEIICEMRSMSEETGHSNLVTIKMSIKGTKTISIVTNDMTIKIGTALKLLGIDTIQKAMKIIGEEPVFKRYLKKLIEDDAEDENMDRISHYINHDIFPHIGILSTNIEKAILIGKMVRKIILTHEPQTDGPKWEAEDRDDYKNKRIETTGILCMDLFKLLYKRFIKSTINQYEKRNRVDIDIISKNSIITHGLHFSFSTGNWGVQKNNYIRTGVSQIQQNKSSLISTLSYLRRMVIPMGREGKNTSIRQIHPSSIFFICPSDTPEGQFVGTTLNLSIIANITEQTISVVIKEIIMSLHQDLRPPEDILNGQNFVVFVNGGPCGVTANPHGLLKDVYHAKLNGNLHLDVCAHIIHDLKEVHVQSDHGRLIRPMINTTHSPNDIPWESFDQCLQMGVVEYKDVHEISNMEIAIDINNADKYDWMEIHPSTMFGIMASQTPFPEHTQSPRLCYQANMAKQAIGFLPSNDIKLDNISRTMNYVQQPLVTTKIAQLTAGETPNGVNAMVAIASYGGFNQEDSIIVNRASIDRGLFHVETQRIINFEEKTINNETICLPPPKIRKMNNYSLLEDDDENDLYGIVRPKSILRKNDVIIGKTYTKVRTDPITGGKDTILCDSSIIASSADEGTVDRIVQTTRRGARIIRIIILQQKRPEIGDKLCSAMAQKGTIGMILNEEDMPFTRDGTIPDIIINPHCIPSRMTINQLMSSILGKTCCAKGEIMGDASPFPEPYNDHRLNNLCKDLQDCGFAYDGTETMMSGITGKKLKAQIFFGPVYYHRLSHMVSDKIFTRANTNQKRNISTRQPLNGRANDGGLRIGEMEKDCLLSHGIVKFLHEKMFDQSDKFILNVCRNCKTYLKVVKNKDLSLSCTKCGEDNIVKINLPFATKLVLQELMAMAYRTELIVE